MKEASSPAARRKLDHLNHQFFTATGNPACHFTSSWFGGRRVSAMERLACTSCTPHGRRSVWFEAAGPQRQAQIPTSPHAITAQMASFLLAMQPCLVSMYLFGTCLLARRLLQRGRQHRSSYPRVTTRAAVRIVAMTPWLGALCVSGVRVVAITPSL